MPPFETKFERVINCPAGDVWNAWSNATTWSKWVFMNMTNSFIIGGHFDNGMGEGGSYLTIDFPNRIHFTWQMKRYLPGSEIEILFSPISDNITKCVLVHHNLQRESDRDDSVLGWTWAMDSLQSFLETGKGLTWEEWEAKQSK